MPLLITPPEPLLTTAQLPTPQLYAIIEAVRYSRRRIEPKTLRFEVSYFATEAASTDPGAVELFVPGLPSALTHAAEPAEISAAGDPFALMEGLLQQALAAVLPAGTVFANVR